VASRSATFLKDLPWTQMRSMTGFGVGGGTVVVPFLYEVFVILGVLDELRMPLCAGTSLISTWIASFNFAVAAGSRGDRVNTLSVLAFSAANMPGARRASRSDPDDLPETSAKSAVAQRCIVIACRVGVRGHT
jgi:hypothetical protein